MTTDRAFPKLLDFLPPFSSFQRERTPTFPASIILLSREALAIILLSNKLSSGLSLHLPLFSSHPSSKSLGYVAAEADFRSSAAVAPTQRRPLPSPSCFLPAVKWSYSLPAAPGYLGGYQFHSSCHSPSSLLLFPCD